MQPEPQIRRQDYKALDNVDLGGKGVPILSGSIAGDPKSTVKIIKHLISKGFDPSIENSGVKEKSLEIIIIKEIGEISWWIWVTRTRCFFE